jgi:uncharacterized membrane protein YfcA
MEGAAQLVRHLAQAGTVETTVRWVQLSVLTALAGVVLWEMLSARNGKQVAWRGILGRLPIPPRFDSPVSHLKGASVWGFLLLGLLTGFMAGIMGGGGGFIRVPAMIYLLGIPTKVAVGTDLVEVLLSAGYGAFTYAHKGFVDFPTALVMLFGGALGARLGAWATFYAPSKQLRGLLGLLLTASAISVALKQFGIGGKTIPFGHLAFRLAGHHGVRFRSALAGCCQGEGRRGSDRFSVAWTKRGLIGRGTGRRAVRPVLIGSRLTACPPQA